MKSPTGHGSFACDDACVPDSVTHANSIRDLYEMAGDPRGPFTTPVLWDRKEGTIVNNESLEILRMLNSAFDHVAKHPEVSSPRQRVRVPTAVALLSTYVTFGSRCTQVDLFPAAHEEALMKMNTETIYPKINNGVYRAGFARTQEAYNTAVIECFDALAHLETLLSSQRFLAGEAPTWLDLRLFHTLVRFDPVYTCYFKTNLARISDYPNLLGFIRDMYSIPAVKRTINMAHIKTHYFTSHPHLNTFAVLPIYDGPNLEEKSGRGQGAARFNWRAIDAATAVAEHDASTEEDQSNRLARQAAGEFVRGVSAARFRVGVDQQYPVEAGRYHLYVAMNCPWCHRVALARALLGLEDAISMDVLFPTRTEAEHPQGEGKWQFLPDGLVARNGEAVRFEGCTVDSVNGMGTIVEVYRAFGNAAQFGEKSLPMLFDKKTATIVNNESSEILRMFSTSLRSLGADRSFDLYPEARRARIDELNELIYTKVNNGVYKAGFSSDQLVYRRAFADYFDTLIQLDGILASSLFLCGDAVTEADLRLFPTIFRHDPVYHNRMKLNQMYIADLPNLWRWMSDVYALPGIAAASPLDQMKQGYFGRTGNGTVPVGPLNYPELLHDREYAARRHRAYTGRN
jgi:putative glutathione S-transferase